MVQHTKNERAIPDALRHFDSLPDSASVRLPVVAALVGCSTATVWVMTCDTLGIRILQHFFEVT